MTDTQHFNSAKVINTFDGILVLGQDESMLFSVGNAEKLRNELNDALAVAAGYQMSRIEISEVEPGMKLALGSDTYTIKNVLEQRNDTIVIQWLDDVGEECELYAPLDFMVTVWTVIE